MLAISSLVRVPSEYFALTQLSRAVTFCHPRSTPPKPPRRVTSSFWDQAEGRPLKLFLCSLNFDKEHSPFRIS
jgi:hypothetical protein